MNGSVDSTGCALKKSREKKNVRGVRRDNRGGLEEEILSDESQKVPYIAKESLESETYETDEIVDEITDMAVERVVGELVGEPDGDRRE